MTRPARTEPSWPATDSSARVTVVPTAITRPPASRVALTSRAVASGTRNRSGCGGSPGSWEDTPVCSTMGASVTPRVTRSVTT